MRVSWLALLLLLLAAPCHAVLVTGDLAVIRVNNSADSFSYVALRDIAANEVLNWTDSSWTEGNSWRATENSGGPLTSSSAILAGTIFNVSVGSGLGNGGEQVFLYSGDFLATSTPASAGLIYGVNWDNAGWLTTGTNSTSNSYLPSTLSGANVSLGTGDSRYYNGPTTGTKASLLSAINTPSNWLSGSLTATTYSADRAGVTAFSITAVPEASAFFYGGLIVAGLVGWKWRQQRRVEQVLA